MNTNKNIQIIKGNLSDPDQASHFLRLTAGYMKDPMGQAEPWTNEQKGDVINDLKNHPLALILFAKLNDQFVGVCTCFFAYSTFMAKPLLNIHDIYVEEGYRGVGVARQLLQALEGAAQEKNVAR
ncbi:MAG: GNAT family N-acetyltransferase [Cyclobacteriaceae bacterium]|nr:GNAT family N-acetyltransferase [Cyclobacteriaceae bacterium]